MNHFRKMSFILGLLLLMQFGLPSLSPKGSAPGSAGRLVYQGSTVDELTLNSVNDLAASADGQFLYALSAFGSGLAVYQVEDAIGTLSLVQHIQDDGSGSSGLLFPRAMELSPDQTTVLVLAYGETGQQLTVFERDGETGRLRRLQDLAIAAELTDLAFSPESDSVYVSGWTGGSPDYQNLISIFSRDLQSGLLGAATAIVNSLVISVPVDSLVVSPDGLLLYSDHYAVFERNPADGQLLALPLSVGYGGTTPIFTGVGDLYAANPSDDSLSVFRRMLPNEDLMLQYSYVDGQNGNQGLEGVCDLTAKDLVMLAVGCAGDSLVYFARNPATAELHLQQVMINGLDGLDGMQNPSAVVWPQQSDLVFVAGRGSDAIVVLRWEALDLSVFLPVVLTK
jgi:hypothetical protein